MVDLSGILNKFGIPWPDADSGRARQAAEDWRVLGAAAEDALTNGNNVVNAVTENNHGAAITAFGDFWDSVGGSRSQSLLPWVVESCHTLAESCDKFAEAVDEAKHKLEAAGIEIAAAITAGAVATFLTFGLSDAVGGAVAAGLAATALGDIALLGSTIAEIVGTLAGALATAAATTAVEWSFTNAARLATGESPESLSPAELAVNLATAGIGTVATTAVKGAATAALDVADGLSDALPQLPLMLAAVPGALDTAGGKVVTELVSGAVAHSIVPGAPEPNSGKEIVSATLDAELEAALDGDK